MTQQRPDPHRQGPGWLVGGNLPGRRHSCRLCGLRFVFAITRASERGRGGKAMPLDLAPNPEGNVAATMQGRSLVCRVLGNDDGFDSVAEVRAMPHFATCKTERDRLVTDVETFLADQSEAP